MQRCHIRVGDRSTEQLTQVEIRASCQGGVGRSSRAEQLVCMHGFAATSRRMKRRQRAQCCSWQLHTAVMGMHVRTAGIQAGSRADQQCLAPHAALVLKGLAGLGAEVLQSLRIRSSCRCTTLHTGEAGGQNLCFGGPRAAYTCQPCKLAKPCSWRTARKESQHAAVSPPRHAAPAAEQHTITRLQLISRLASHSSRNCGTVQFTESPSLTAPLVAPPVARSALPQLNIVSASL